MAIQVEMAIDASDRRARECRALSIDPTVVHGAAERAKAEDLEFSSQRLRASVAPLRSMLNNPSSVSKRLRGMPMPTKSK
jgi:hypothetical protein